MLLFIIALLQKFCDSHQNTWLRKQLGIMSASTRVASEARKLIRFANPRIQISLLFTRTQSDL